MNLAEYYKNLKLKKINKHDNEVLDFLNLFKKEIPFGFSRFNDGEMMGIDKIGAVVARGDQSVNESLHKSLIKSIQHTQKNYYVGVPCSICYPHYNKLAIDLVKQPKKYIKNAVSLTNRNWIKFITEFPESVKNNRIVWISGEDQNIDFLRDIGLNIVNHHKFPSKDSWKHYDATKGMYEQFSDEHDVVMISLGPTARIFVSEMFKKYPNKTFVDIGSTFDPFTRNIWHNCHKGWIESGFNNTGKCKICN